MRAVWLPFIVTPISRGLGHEVEALDFDPVTALADKGIVVDVPRIKGGSNSSCESSCFLLSTIFPNGVIPGNSTASENWSTSFWAAQQAEVHPSCIFQPASASNVSVAVLISRVTNCPFAVKSGGHAPFAGASNIEGGVTIDLHKLNGMTLTHDDRIAQVGPGLVWNDVYTSLQTRNLTAIGGRVAHIGTGGLTLGGGISFFSNQYGWACDNVDNYEVVTANGAIIEVNARSFPDLYWALRGGGNNFGIVTRFDLRTIKQGLMWGGTRIYPYTSKKALINAFTSFAKTAPFDPKAALILSFGYAQGQWLSSTDVEYADPISSTDLPPIFSGFQNLTTIMDTTKVSYLADLTSQLQALNPNGLRETYWTATYKLNETLAEFIVDTFAEEMKPLVDTVPGMLPGCVLQAITTAMTSHMSQNGGNALGLSPEDGPLILLGLSIRWSNKSDDEAIMRATANVLSKAAAQAKAWSLEHRYLYMNYASEFQDVISSYGEENRQRLRDVARRYDPQGVFQRLQPGYFKLDGGQKSNGGYTRSSYQP